MRLRPLPFVLVLVLVATGDASAQDVSSTAPRPPSAPAAVPPTATAAPKKKDDARKRRFEVEADEGLKVTATVSRFGDKGVSYAIGNVHVQTKRSGRIQLFADGAVIWGEVAGTKDFKADIEVYAEGNVFLQAFGDTFEADWIWIDFRTGEARFEKGTARLTTGTTGIEGWDPLESTCRHASLSIL